MTDLAEAIHDAIEALKTPAPREMRVPPKIDGILNSGGVSTFGAALERARKALSA